MDIRLEVTDSPRVVFPGLIPDVPLVTIAWRALRSDYQRRADDRRKQEAELGRMRDTLASVAEETHRLRRLARRDSVSEGNEAPMVPIAAAAQRVEDALAKVGLTVLAPEGERFTDEWMDVFENIAQTQDPSIREPTVAEVVAPAVIYQGALLRRGKAIIAVPPPQRSED